jgi:hypothetical protein
MDHIKRALTHDEEEKALHDLDRAFEHLRRGGTESIQRAATKSFFGALKYLNTPSIALKITCLDIPNQKKIRQLKRKAMNKIAEGRTHKADKKTWTAAIDSFRESIELSNEIEDSFPEKTAIRWRLIILAFGTVTILSLIFGIYGIFFS